MRGVEGWRSLHSGSFPSSMARRLLILDLATLAAAMVLVMLSWPRLRPGRMSVNGLPGIYFSYL